MIWNDSGYYVKYNTATIDLPTPENLNEDLERYSLPEEVSKENWSPNRSGKKSP